MDMLTSAPAMPYGNQHLDGRKGQDSWAACQLSPFILSQRTQTRIPTHHMHRWYSHRLQHIIPIEDTTMSSSTSYPQEI